jgi:WD40 repeat protein
LLRLQDLDDEQPVCHPLFAADSGEGVHEIASYPDGQRLLVRGNRGSLLVVDLESGRRLVERHFKDMRSVSLAPDGSTAAVCEQHTDDILLLDPETLQVRRRLSGHRSPNRMAFSHDGQRAVSVGDDRLGFVWDVATGERLQTLTGHLHSVFDVAFSRDDRLVVTGDMKGHTKLWSVATGSEILQWSLPEGSLGRISFSPDGDWLFLSQFEGAVAAFEATPLPVAE